MTYSSIINELTGMIDLQADGTNFSHSAGTNSLDNKGIIKKTSLNGTSTIGTQLINNGTLQVENGTLAFTNSSNQLNSGVYNMAGQSVISQNISAKTGINVAKLPAGNYVLKLTDKNGNTEVTQFIKK